MLYIAWVSCFPYRSVAKFESCVLYSPLGSSLLDYLRGDLVANIVLLSVNLGCKVRSSSPRTQSKLLPRSSQPCRSINQSTQYRSLRLFVGPTRYRVSIYILGQCSIVWVMLSISLDSLPQPEMNAAPGRLFLLLRARVHRFLLRGRSLPG